MALINKKSLINYLILILLVFIFILLLFPVNAGAQEISPLQAASSASGQQLLINMSAGSKYTGRTIGEIIKIALIAALIITAIVVGTMFGLHRASLKKAPCATSYTGKKGFRERGRSDIFIGSRTTRVKIQKNNTGHGSMGGGHSAGPGKGRPPR